MFLYKVISEKNWQESQNAKILLLDPMDKEFIHLAMESQLDRIISKFWGEGPKYIVLKLDVNLLQGNLVLEANPGGTHQYYHLYDGSIPLKSVLELVWV